MLSEPSFRARRQGRRPDGSYCDGFQHGTGDSLRSGCLHRYTESLMRVIWNFRC